MGSQTYNINGQDTLKMKDLTKRQFQVLRYIAQGDTNEQIALKLHLSNQTVRLHVYNLMKKLNARNRAHAVAIYYRILRNLTANHLMRHLTTQNPQHTTMGSSQPIASALFQPTYLGGAPLTPITRQPNNIVQE
jgi:DNA-binding CsgD family transcriptional regulator